MMSFNDVFYEALEPFFKMGREKKVPMMIGLVATCVIRNSGDNWRTTLKDIVAMLEDSKDAKEFEIRLRKKYPGKTIDDIDD